MNSVLVLGAGASVAQASAAGVRPLLQPPTDADFFSKAAALSTRKGFSLVGFLSAIRKGAERLSLDDPWSAARPSMELFFGDVYNELASAPPGDPENRSRLLVYEALMHSYIRTIQHTTNWTVTRRGLGPLGELIKHLSSTSKSVVIISFNHDLLVENAIWRMKSLEHRWCLHSLYQLPALVPMSGEATSGHRPQRFPLDDGPCTHDPPITLLKLHGSLNWVFRLASKRPRRSDLFSRNPKRPVLVLDWRKVQLSSLVSLGAGGRRKWYPFPIVVPPIFDKSGMIGGSLLDRVWALARSAIGDADSLVLFGYSLPEADGRAHYLLRGAGKKKQALSAVHCVNPDFNVAARIKRVIRPAALHLYDDSAQYIAANPSSPVA